MWGRAIIGGLFGALALTATAGAEDAVIGFAQDHMANDWRAAQVRDVEAGLAERDDVEYLFTDAGGSTAQQIVDIEGLAGRNVDVLITSPRDAALMAPVLAKVKAQGIPVVLLSRTIQGDAYDTFIHADNEAIARAAADHLAEVLDGRGRILMLQHIPTTTPGRLRTEGFMEEIANYPDIEVVAIKRADSLRSKAILAVEEALAEGLEFDAIYAQSDSMAAGARLALEKAGIDPATVPTVGIDYIAEAAEAIRAGKQSASFTYPTFGREGAQAALDILDGKTVPREIIVESIKVTPDNVDEVAPIF